MMVAVLDFILMQINSLSHSFYNQSLFRILKVLKSMRALRAIRVLRRLRSASHHRGAEWECWPESLP